MHSNLRRLCWLALILAAPLAHSACPLAETIVRQAYPEAMRTAAGGYRIGAAQVDADGPHAVICKTWPAHPELTLAAVPLIAHSDADGSRGDLDVLVLDSRSLQVRWRLHLPDRMTDDAVRIQEIAFDTARYQLSPAIMAFGLRVHKRNGSRLNPYEETDLSLFGILDDRLQSLLDQLVIASDGGERDGDCAGTFSTSRGVLVVAAARHAGLADLVLRRTEADHPHHLDHDLCHEETQQRQLTTTLRFDGQSYEIPADLKALQ